MAQLILKRASASRPSGQWQDEDYDVLADGKVVGRIYEDASASTPPYMRWVWSVTEIVPAIPNRTNAPPRRAKRRWRSFVRRGRRPWNSRPADRVAGTAPTSSSGPPTGLRRLASASSGFELFDVSRPACSVRPIDILRSCRLDHGFRHCESLTAPAGLMASAARAPLQYIRRYVVRVRLVGRQGLNLRPK
jgi:hypothetical protein